MRPTSSLVQLALCFYSLGPLTVAWPDFLPPRDSLIARADESTDASSRSITVDTASSTSAVSSTPTPSTTGSDTPTVTGSTSSQPKSTSSGKHKSTDSKHTTFPPDAPAGGVSMTKPNTMLQATPLFKIGDNVTLGWNYTSLLAKPTAVDVILSCQTADATWTLTGNMSFATSVSYVWNSAKQGDDSENPLLTAMYTLIIKDSDAEITDIPEPGYLGASSGFHFGMYMKQHYEGLDTWQCPGGCGGAPPSLGHNALGLAVTMSIITFFSFTWFVSGLGLH